MRTWKNYLCMLAALVVTLGFTSCESDEDIGFDLSGLYGGTFIKYYKISQLIHTQIIAN